MDVEKLIEDLRGLLKQYGEKIPYGELVGAPWPYSRSGDLVWQDPEPYFIEQAATALSTLQAENAQLRADLEYEREHANAYHEECGQWEAENEKLRAELEQKEKYYEQMVDALAATESAELEQVKRERDAAMEDVAAIIGDVEEIRRGYGVDNADADGAFAELCETYCANKGRFCYAECEKYHCKNFKWRGI